jgi:hypothetical protein
MAAYTKNNYASSGFLNNPENLYENKYFDIYPEGSRYYIYKNRILGDATREMGPFYYYAEENGTYYIYHNSWWNDRSNFITAWLARGGYNDNGVIASQFSFTSYTPNANQLIGSRIVLAN